MQDIRQNKKYSHYLEKQNWIVEEKNGVFYYIKKVLFFSVMKTQRPKKIDLEFLTELAKKYRAINVIIEPTTFKEADSLIEKGWKITSPFIPSKTVILDLKKTEKNIFDSFSKDTRYSLRKSEKVKIAEEKDGNSFHKLWKASVKPGRHILKPKEIKNLQNVFKDNCKILIAEDGSPRGEALLGISGGIFLVAEDVGYYWYGFVGEPGRKALSQYKVLWEGIKWAKKRGAKYFDMEGIFDERFPIPAWRGFTKFKKGFGGTIKKYPGAYQKILLPF